MQRHFETTKAYKWQKFLPKFVSNYNHRKHSTTHLKPADMVADHTLVPAPLSEPTSSKGVKNPPVGTTVRLNRLRGAYEKEATGTWTKELFKVRAHKKNRGIPQLYVEDQSGEPIEGALYPEEYQVVKP